MRLTAYTLAPEMSEDESACLDKLIKHCRVEGAHIEIGTAAGGSLCRMILADGRYESRSFVVVDPMTYFPGQLRAVQRNLSRHSIPLDVVDIRRDTSLDAREKSIKLGEKFAFILIDGKHDLLHVMQDLLWTRQLLPGGIVCLHDFSCRYPGVKRAVRSFLRRHPEAYEMIERTGSLVSIRKLQSQLSGSEFAIGEWTVAKAEHTTAAASKKLRRIWRRSLQVFVEFLASRGLTHRNYSNLVLRRLARGKGHPTLGPTPSSDGCFEFKALLALGLRTTHFVVDFGCGSLRVGRHLIDYLSDGQYWGFDVAKSLIRLGLDTWYVDRVLPTSVRLGVMSRKSLAKAASERPDLVLVFGVLQSVPPSKLLETMRSIARCCALDTVVIVTFLEATSYTRLGVHAHRHALGDIEGAARSSGLRMEVFRSGMEPQILNGAITLGADTTDRGTILLLRRSDASPGRERWDWDAARKHVSEEANSNFLLEPKKQPRRYIPSPGPCRGQLT
jgi:predicted O-methyltransferase YrrM/SAM-dependent methyltransferase